MIAIVSDIHGNYPALSSVLKEVDRRDVKQIISLGDVAGYYPFINECIDALRERDVVHLMGNHDYYIVSGIGCPRSKSVNELAALQQKKITPENMEWLAASQICYVDRGVSMVHGGWDNPLDEYILKVSNRYFRRLAQKFFFSGHTHLQGKFNLKNGQVYCNPGSVGQPRDGNPKAAFALFDWQKIELCRVDYNIDIVVKALREYGFSDYYTDNLYKGSQIGGKVERAEYFSK